MSYDECWWKFDDNYVLTRHDVNCNCVCWHIVVVFLKSIESMKIDMRLIHDNYCDICIDLVRKYMVIFFNEQNWNWFDGWSWKLEENHVIEKTRIFGKKTTMTIDCIKWQSIALVKILKKNITVQSITLNNNWLPITKKWFFTKSVAKCVSVTINCIRMTIDYIKPNSKKLCFCFVALFDDFDRIFWFVSPSKVWFEALEK